MFTLSNEPVNNDNVWNGDKWTFAKALYIVRFVLSLGSNCYTAMVSSMHRHRASC